MMRVCLLLSVLVLVCGVTDPWMGTSPSDDWLVFPSTRTLTLFYSPSSLFISLSSHVMDVFCMFLFCSLSVLVSVCRQMGCPILGCGCDPSNDWLVFPHSHSFILPLITLFHCVYASWMSYVLCLFFFSVFSCLCVGGWTARSLDGDIPYLMIEWSFHPLLH